MPRCTSRPWEDPMGRSTESVADELEHLPCVPIGARLHATRERVHRNRGRQILPRASDPPWKKRTPPLCPEAKIELPDSLSSADRWHTAFQKDVTVKST